MIRQRAKTLGALLAVFVAYAGCDGANVFVQDSDGVEIILAEGFTLNDGDTYDLDVAVRDDSGKPIDVSISWRTSNASVATVNNAGVVTANHPGAARISASARGRTKSTTVTVRSVPIALQLVSGGDQEGLANAALADELVVRVVDRHDEGVAGVAVAFNVTAGGGSAAPSGTETDDEGYASTTWTLGSNGAQQVQSVATPPAHVESIPDAAVTFSATAIVETPPPPPPGNPSSVTDLEVANATETSVTLRWTAVGDGAGGSSNYAVRYGSPTLQWSQAGSTQRTIGSGQVGSEIEYTYTGLDADETYQFRLVSYRGTMGQNEVVGGQSNTVTANTDAPPAPSTGTLVIAVNGLGSGAANAGSVVIQRNAGPSQTVTIPASGTTTANLAPDSYTIAYTAPTGYQLGSGQTANRQAVITSGATSTVTFVVQETTAPPPPVVATVTANPSSHTFTQAGATRQVTATARDASGDVINGAQFSWRSTNAAAVTVNTTGLMTAVADGNAQVIVTSGNAADTVAVSVDLPTTPPPPAVATVTATPSSHTFTEVGAQQLISVAARNGSGALVPDVQFNWSSTNSSVVSVDNMGRMTANAAGTALIIVSAVCCNASDTVTATVDLWEEPTPPPPPPPGGALVFSSDWSTATGNSEQAVMDGGRWDFASQGSWPSSNKAVVSAAGLDFPTQNVFRVTAEQSGSGWTQVRALDLSVPAVGESRYYRWYMRLQQPGNTSDRSNHPIEAKDASPFAVEVETGNGDTWGIWIYVAGGGTGGNAGQFNWMRWYLGSQNNPVQLSKSATYRIELAIHRTGSSTGTMDARVYDSSGALLYDTDDWHNIDGVAMGAAITLSNVNNLREWWFGLNGIAGSGPFPFVYAYYGGVCLRSDTWCGAYNGTY